MQTYTFQIFKSTCIIPYINSNKINLDNKISFYFKIKFIRRKFCTAQLHDKDNNMTIWNNFRITAKIDDEMLAYYCNEDMFLLEVRPAGASEDEPLYDITFVELPLDH